MTFWCGTPIALISSIQAIEAAPAPFETILISFNSRPVRCRAFIRPAAAIMAVPCWSSWNTGISITSRRRCSMIKHSGDLISSRLIPPKEGPISETASTNLSISSVDNSISTPSISANFLKRTALPSITGFEAAAPILPSPKTAVPLEITATTLPLAV